MMMTEKVNESGSLAVTIPGAKRNHGDRYDYVIDPFGSGATVEMTEFQVSQLEHDWWLNLVSTTMTINAIVVRHGCFGWTRLERTVQGSWMIWDSTVGGYRRLSSQRFLNPESAINALFGV